MSYMSNLFISERPELAPAKCARCGGNQYDGRKYVDFGVDLELPPIMDGPVAHGERHGVVYLCSHCIREIFKFVFPDEGPPVAPLEAKVADLQQTVALQSSLLETAHDMIDKMEKAYGILTFNTNDSDVDTSGVASDSERIEESIDGGKEEEQRVTEQVTESGRSDVPSLAELLKPKSKSNAVSTKR